MDTLKRLKIAVAEDKPAAAIALKSKLDAYGDIHIVFWASNGQVLLNELAKNASIDVVLMDMDMPIMSGIEATSQVCALYPHIKIIMLTIYDDDASILKAIQNGAHSYLLKDVTANKLYETIQDTLNGGAVMSPSIAFKAMALLRDLQQPVQILEVLEPLTDRESVILNLISQGQQNKQIAETLSISPFTVKRHIENIYQKLKTHNRIEMINKAKQHRLL